MADVSSASADPLRYGWFGCVGCNLPLTPWPKHQGSQPYLDVIHCDFRESAAAFDAALHHETELLLNEHFTDTRGYTELMFGLFELEPHLFSTYSGSALTRALPNGA